MNIEVSIEKIAFGGDGLGEVGGKTCFIEGALPGEIVTARVTQDKKNFIKAKVVKVLKSSPFRVEAPCVYVNRCGGCQYQHVEYEEELHFKESQLNEIFQRSLLHISIPPIKPMVTSKKPYGYRNNVTLHRTVQDGRKPQALGFVGSDNTSKLTVKNCLIADPRLEPLFQTKFILNKNIEKVSFKLSEKGELFSDREDLFLRISILGETLLVHSKGFFQNNLSVTELLVKRIADWVKLSECQVFFDLYAGVGSFSFLCGKTVPKIYGVEENPYSVHAMRMNKEEKKFSQMAIVAGRTENIYPSLFETEKNSKCLVLLDPPRQGIEAGLASYLSAEGVPDRLIYISCDPLTLVRDLKIILSNGCYELETIEPFDMFPRTKHIETAVVLKKKTASMVQN